MNYSFGLVECDFVSVYHNELYETTLKHDYCLSFSRRSIPRKHNELQERGCRHDPAMKSRPVGPTIRHRGQGCHVLFKTIHQSECITE